MSQTVPTGRTHLRRRPPRPRRFGRAPWPRVGRLHEHHHREPRPARPPRPGRGELLVPGSSAGVRVPRRRNRRRHPREQHPAGGVHLRQHDDPRDRRARELRALGEEAALPRQLVHLPARCAPADDRRGTPHRSARTHQRGVRDRQDRRHQALPVLPRAVRRQLHLGDADEPLRAERQLRPAEQPRAAGADAQVPRREGQRARERSRCGARARPSESSSTSTTSPTRACSSWTSTRARSTSTSAPASTSASASSPRPCATWCTPRPSSCSTPSKPDGAPRKLLDVESHQRTRVEGDDRAARGHRVDLRVVPRAPRAPVATP